MMTRHVPVLMQQVLDGLSISEGQTVVDCTLGGGGHALAMIDRLHGTGRFIGIEQDPTALAALNDRFAPFVKKVPNLITILVANFGALANADFRSSIPPVNALLADLGISSDQLDDETLGISFRVDAPLDMRLSRDRGEPAMVLSRAVRRGETELRRPFSTLEKLLDAIPDPSAADLVNGLEEGTLADLISTYGEERWSHKIAWAIVKARKEAPIIRTTQLAEVIAKVVPRKPGPAGAIHPATQTFQALRIVVNQELESLDLLLHALPELMAPQGRAAIISFHSLEDRLVKNAFRSLKERGLATILTPKPIEASPEEVASNPRARSAKLRIIAFK